MQCGYTISKCTFYFYNSTIKSMSASRCYARLAEATPKTQYPFHWVSVLRTTSKSNQLDGCWPGRATSTCLTCARSAARAPKISQLKSIS